MFFYSAYSAISEFQYIKYTLLDPLGIQKLVCVKEFLSSSSKKANNNNNNDPKKQKPKKSQKHIKPCGKCEKSVWRSEHSCVV